MGTSHMSLLRATGLAVGFGGQPLIEGVDLHLNAGECVALIGLNGAGKSTLLNSLAGLHDPMAGRVEVEGRPLTELSANERAKRIAMVLTGRPQVGLLDVRTLVALGRQPWTGHFGRLAAKDLDRVQNAMIATDTLPLADRAVSQLSDGEAQRVLIARALAQDTAMLLLDEPMAFLDLVNRVRILRLLRDLAHEQHKGVLLSTHDLGSALELCDRIFLVHDRQLWSGTTDEARTSGFLQRAFAVEGLQFDAGTGSFRSV